MVVQPFIFAIFESSSGRRQLLTVPTTAARAALDSYLKNTLNGSVWYDWHKLANSSAINSAITYTSNLGGVAYNLPEA